MRKYVSWSMCNLGAMQYKGPIKAERSHNINPCFIEVTDSLNIIKLMIQNMKESTFSWC